MIGKLLDHRYQVVKVLATGGFGETYIAQDTKRPGHPICVVKHLKPANSDPKVFETAKRLFHSEAETLEKLGSHDQIPRLLAYFDENQEFYLVQELIEGHPLSEELVPGQRWSENQVIQLLQEVLSILVFVHRQGVIHRDIKPDNIIRRDADQKLVLVDFGAVKQLRRSPGYFTQTLIFPGAQPSATVAIGTPGYMPTEQGQGKPRPNSDIYALGIIAIQALTGVSPMDLQEDPHTGEILWQDLVTVSDELAVVLNKMIHYHFKDRYQSATEALQALQTLAAAITPVKHPHHLSYHSPLLLHSPPSQQKTIAVAPTNSVPQLIAGASPQPIARGTNRFDLLQLFILICLTGSAAALSPVFMKNVQSFTNNLTKNPQTSSTRNCSVVVVGNSNIRSEPNSITSNTIVQTTSKDTTFEVTGKRTKRGWIQIRVAPQRLAWAHTDVIKNPEDWTSCLRDQGIAIKTIDDSKLIVDRPLPTVKSKPSPNPNVKAQPLEKSRTPKNDAKVVTQAHKKYESGDVQGAIALLKSVTTNSAAGIRETGRMISQWQQDWTKAEALFNDINTALAEGQWEKVMAYKENPEKLPNIQYWRAKIEQLFKQADDHSVKQQSLNKSNLDSQKQSQGQLFNLIENRIDPDEEILEFNELIIDDSEDSDDTNEFPEEPAN